jgi:DNA-directed RNA polymerase subunit RPC12/RpoP
MSGLEKGKPMAEVELISSGYAWRCPECSRTEYENAVPASRTVRCTRCGASFAVRRVCHRAEGGLLDSEQVACDARTVVPNTSVD